MRSFCHLIALWLACSPVALAASPGTVALVSSQSFTLAQPYRYTWTKAKHAITEGTIIVVQVHPDDARVRQAGGKVLYVGAVPAERANNGDLDGHIIAFVPGQPDLDVIPVFWGPATLPEQVDTPAGQAARENATHHINQPLTQGNTRTAPLRLSDGAALYGHLADLIDEYAPSEPERAKGYRSR
jgi:hypothetical protein